MLDFNAETFKFSFTLLKIKIKYIMCIFQTNLINLKFKLCNLNF